jgi:hypothetical protein
VPETARRPAFAPPPCFSSRPCFFGQAAPNRIEPHPPIKCDSCDEWNQPREPFKVFGKTYYVGVAGLSAVLIASDAGLIVSTAPCRSRSR